MLSQHMLLFVWDARKTFFHWIYDQTQKFNEDLSKIHVKEVKHGSNFFPENLVSKISNFWTQKYPTIIAVTVGDHGELIIPMAYLTAEYLRKFRRSRLGHLMVGRFV